MHPNVPIVSGRYQDTPFPRQPLTSPLFLLLNSQIRYTRCGTRWRRYAARMTLCECEHLRWVRRSRAWKRRTRAWKRRTRARKRRTRRRGQKCLNCVRRWRRCAVCLTLSLHPKVRSAITGYRFYHGSLTMSILTTLSRFECLLRRPFVGYMHSVTLSIWSAVYGDVGSVRKMTKVSPGINVLSTGG